MVKLLTKTKCFFRGHTWEKKSNHTGTQIEGECKCGLYLVTIDCGCGGGFPCDSTGFPCDTFDCREGSFCPYRCRSCDGKGEYKRIVNSKQLEALNNKLPEKNTCFIATAVYDSSSSNEVLILRNFRDQFLLSHNLGVLFVNIYYACSPPIAKVISHSLGTKRVFKCTLDPLIKMIEKKMMKYGL